MRRATLTARSQVAQVDNRLKVFCQRNNKIYHSLD